jgi:hypothetical protein
VSIFVALAPVTQISHAQALIFRWLAHFYDEIDDVLNLLHIHSMLNSTWYNSDIEKVFCGLLPPLCKLLEKLLITKNPALDDTDRYEVYLGHMPNGSSTKAILHYT